MKKFTKDQLQKIILSSLMMIGLIYCYFTFLIAALNKSDVDTANTIDKLDKQIAAAKSNVKRSASVEEQARSSEELLAQVSDMVPDGAPIAWFPPRMNTFFTRHGVKGVAVRSAGIDATTDPVMKDFRNANWTVDIPQVGSTALGITLAGLENEEKLLEITKLQVTTQVDAPEKQRVSLNLLTLLK